VIKGCSVDVSYLRRHPNKDFGTFIKIGENTRQLAGGMNRWVGCISVPQMPRSLLRGDSLTC
jgi:hypothetical protein